MKPQLSASDDPSKRNAAVIAPAVSLPKGGGAIRGIGEKFAANPVTGSGAFTVPIATSPGRAGFGPDLSLSYDSGAGNGPFGIGWHMSLPSVTRKTEKGIPRYDDQAESDVFLLSGYEDLVPVLAADGTRLEDKSTAPGYTIHRYRPRIEGLFSRIERWTRDDGDIHWRSISRDNILTLYGEDSNSRIADPDDPKRIFKWLLCQSRDDKGNALLYEYKTDDGAGVDILQAHERNRGAADDPRRRTNRHIKRIFYGNRVSLLDDQGKRPRFVNATHFGRADWMFEVVFDYGEHDGESPEPGEDRDWLFRDDPFSVYRAGFEVRTTRLCQRVLMFHHFASEPEVGANCLVRSTDFTYAHEQNPNHERNPVYTFLRAVTHAGYRRQGSQYLKQSLPPVEFEYSLPVVQQAVEDIDPDSLENLPIGVDGGDYRWIDLHGEGIPGILTEQATGWYYKRNLSPINNGRVAFTAVERVPVKPNLALAAGAQLVDLAGDGQLDLVTHELTPGFFEHDGDRGWLPFRPFSARLNRDMREPNLRLIDLNGDGHADLLITEDDTFVWHASLAEAGFGPAQQVARALDEETGPRIVFADGTESIYLADMSGDGLTDIVRIRNGEVCYWPNLGYARFGVKVTMDQSPVFDNPDQFEHNRLQLADIDGTGTVDLIYLHRDGVRLFYNQSGNSWSTPSFLSPFPDIDEVTRISATDLLGNGTACLVWSSPLQRDARRRMRFVNLMGDQKPHLLIKMVNNLGAETHVHYASSTKFYLTDERGGKPWITRLPFPVHVVERVDIYDCISRNRFMTRYAYHHGYFDGEEREFRGFGMVEQWDAEEIGALSDDGAMSEATNLDAESNLPPVHTKSWFHTGVYVRRASVSRHYSNEYYREPALSDQALEAQLLPDTVLPRGLTLEEEVEACRALKGMMLRQEVYADDAAPGASPAAIERARTPYSVVEQNFTVKLVQGRGDNHHGVFFTHPREAITYHYERNPQDPRVQHALTLEVDVFGNVLQGITIGYGRRQADPALPLLVDRDKQTQSLVTYSSSGFTNATDAPDAYRTPLPCESQTYELTGFRPAGNAVRFSFDEWARNNFALLASAAEIAYEQEATGTAKQRRLIEHQRSLFRDDDLTRLLPLGESGSLGLTGESYQLAFTPGLLSQVYQREGQPLLASPSTVLGGQGADSGGYVTSDDQKTGGLFPDSDPDNHWWVPGGRSFLSADSNANAAQERHYARTHFFLPQRYRDAFGQTTTVTYDDYDLLLVETRDPVGNRVTVGSRDPAGNLLAHGNDYRVLQPRLVMDPNRNRTEVAFDTLGMVVGTAIMGKPEEDLGDSLQGFQADLSEIQLVEQLTQPLADPQAVLGRATSRLIYDLFAYQRSQDQPQPEPAVVQTLARETHVAQLGPGESTKVQLSLSYSDGFGREIQHKIRAESETIDGVTGPPRWVGSGWTIFNNKGKPVRQYEPFFSATHGFEFGVVVGVSAVVFYDPLQRVIVTLHPNCSYEKVRFDPWQQISWDVNDTVLSDPRTDPDIAAHVATYFTAQPAWETWYAQRQGGALGTKEQEAALKAAAHADTPARSYFDVLGRPFMSMAHNKVKASNHELNGADEKLCSRIALDIEGNQREVRDAVQQNGDAAGRIVMRHAYDMLGNQIYQLSMEAGARWALNDVTGALIRSWDSRGHITRAAYDPLRRPIRTHVLGADPTNAANELLTDRLVYGEQHPEAEVRNLRGAVYLQLDQAGAVTTEVKDFKGNVLQSSRRIAREYKRSINWQTVESVVPATASLDVAALEASLAVYLEFETYTGGTEYDALNRPILLRTPHTPSRSPSIIRPTYNVAGLLERVDAVLRGETANGQPVWTAFVTNVDYDAKGQRQRVEYGNGVSTFYGYDRDTFRLVHLLTKRNSVVFPEDCPAAPPNSWPGCHIQNLHYTYDPAGNITHIHDTAQQTIFFRNKRVEPSNDYTYDALYRLIEATGREHLSQYSTPIPHSHNDAGRVNLLSADGVGRFAPNDGNAMGRYVERYVYDAVGNFLKMNHRGTDPAHAGWTRAYSYAEDSLIESNKKSNRLSQTTLGAGNTGGEPYTHDAHGNMTQMNHLPLMRWNYRDQLQATARHVVDDNVGTPETTYYVYDSTGQRMRKVTERQAAAGQAPTRKEERIYLGGFESFRKFGTNGSAVSAERETLHVMDDKHRVALVETRIHGNEAEPREMQRYQLGNHLGSATIEINEHGQLISHEEYTPFGNTAFQTMNARLGKRYRFAAKERDEESGFCYYGTRYLSPWLAQWLSPDPAGAVDSYNLYLFVTLNPTSRVDKTGLSTDDFNFSDDDLKQFSASADKELADAERKKSSKLDDLERDFIDRGEHAEELQKKTKPGKATKPSTPGKRLKKKVAAAATVATLAIAGASGPEAPKLPPGSAQVLADEKRKKDREKPKKKKKPPFVSPKPTEKMFTDAEIKEWEKKFDADVAGKTGPNKPSGPSGGGSGPRGGLGPQQRTPVPTDTKAKQALVPSRKPDVKVPVPAPGSSVKKKGLRAVGEVIANRGARLVPVVGTAAGAYAVADELAKGNIRRAALEAVGASEIPIVSQVADAGLLVEDVGWATKDALDPDQKAEQWAHENLSWLGF